MVNNENNNENNNDKVLEDTTPLFHCSFEGHKSNRASTKYEAMLEDIF